VIAIAKLGIMNGSAGAPPPSQKAGACRKNKRAGFPSRPFVWHPQPVLVRNLQFIAFLLPDGIEQFAEPGFVDVEGLSAGDTREFDRAQLAVAVFVVTDNPRRAGHCRFNGFVRAFLDEFEVRFVGAAARA